MEAGSENVDRGVLEFGDDRYMLLAALKGFHLALRRYEECRQAENEDEAFIPLTEALWWVVCIDEGFCAIDGSAYKEARDSDQDGRVFQGLRYARNRAGHQRALVIRLRAGGDYPKNYPYSYRELVWQRAKEVPPPPGNPDQLGFDTYRKYLEGRAARITLEQLKAWFVKARNRDGSSMYFPPQSLTSAAGEGQAVDTQTPGSKAVTP